jgi:hypothetical protein
MQIDPLQTLEDAIIGKVVMALIDNGYRVEMCDQDGGGLHVYAAALDENEGRKPRSGFRYWVKLVPGNGADVISDYTTNLEAVLKDVNAFAKLHQR